MREAVIVDGIRTAVGRSKKGTTRNARADDMMAAIIAELIRRTDGALAPEAVDDVIVGCAMPEGSQGLNVAPHNGAPGRAAGQCPSTDR